MKEQRLAAFFSADPEDAMRALLTLTGQANEGARSQGAVTSTETFYPVAREERMRAAQRGIFSEVIFGPVLDDRCACGATEGQTSRGVTCPRCGVLCDRSRLRDERWGHLEVANVVHPSVYWHLAGPLGIYVEDLRHVVGGKKALRPVDARERSGRGVDVPEQKIRWQVVLADDLDDGDLIGPCGLAEALRRSDPEHPLLPLCTIAKVPVPPPGDRPLAPIDAPTQVTPWIGPLNETWLNLVERATRERRLLELDAPPPILRDESIQVQLAFEAVVRQTRRSYERLVPPLVRVPDGLADSEARSIAFVGSERLIVQLRDRVSILDRAGNGLSVLPPAGTRLRGVVSGRFAVFEGFFGATHPTLTSTDSGFGDDLVHVDNEGVTRIAPILGEISVIDCETGVYLDRPPPGVALRFVTNDEPEDLFLTTADGQQIRRLRAGGDRPTAIAYAPGMALAWVGEEGSGTEIIELARGIPHACPSEPPDGDIPRWDILSSDAGRAGEEDHGEDDEFSANAVAFCDGAWHLLWSRSVLCDHRAGDAVRLHPPPEAAAFDPTGRTLALLVQGTIVLADVGRREVVGRFGLPGIDARA
ncbi:hypothetical protein OV203_05710 [Nannocystis sp. ILAH1]|uniref:hypothetical protein n=1 Tax=Nannocystis sp. ILAH1 TaxID=2996789 RepID=UPI002270E09D|nr:hypothetical protein [Nannocystis sp. ILAH1]MCY0986605.1 hypothetical protein [Nannocystis sp. ILAH1]